LAAVHAAPVSVQVPLSVGHWVAALAAVHAIVVLTLQFPVAGQFVDALAAVHAAPVLLQVPLMVGQLAFVVQVTPVCTEHLPTDGHCAAALAGWQATPVREQLPLISAHCATDVQTVPVLMLQWPAAAQVALLRHDVPVRLQLPGIVVQTAAALAAVQVAPLIVHLPAVVVVQVGGGHVVLSEHVPHSGPTQVLQPGGSNAVVQDPGGGSTQTVLDVMLSQVCVLTLLQTCADVLQDCVWNPLQLWLWMLLQVCVCEPLQVCAVMFAQLCVCDDAQVWGCVMFTHVCVW
jgi:hypothetical protein